MDEKKYVINVFEQEGKGFIALPESSIKIGTTASQVQKKFDGTLAKIETHEDGEKWAMWGKCDDLPTRIRRKLCSVPMAATAIYKLIAMMYGNGICYYNTAELQQGTKVQRAYLPEVEMFLKKNRIIDFLLAQFSDYRYYMNTFSELIFSRDKQQIVGLHHLSAEFCRVAKQSKNMRIEELFFSPQFGDNLGAAPHHNDIQRLRLFSHIDYNFDRENYVPRLKKKVAWHSKFPTPGHTYYAYPFWMALFKEDGWLDVATDVPGIIRAMQKNQVTLKYQLLVPESYFKIRHPDWDSYTQKDREKHIGDFVAKLNELLSDTSNQFKSITTIFRDDPSFANSEGKIEIKTIDDKIKTDSWVPSSSAADIQIVHALGLHPSQLGMSPEGGKIGAGSGSDQRESFNTAIQLNTIDQEIILEPLNFISEYNDWGVTFCMDHTAHTTTNNQEDGLVHSNTTIEVE